MGTHRRYISVILPLRLSWEPYYALPEGVEVSVGDRVRVVFAGRLYLGTVSATDVHPEPETLSRILEIREAVSSKARILPTEIAFWRKLAEYYLCTVGEVFKAAYPSAKDCDVKARSASEEYVPMVDEIKPPCPTSIAAAARLQSALLSGKPALLSAPDVQPILEVFCHTRSSEGGNILWLVPEIRMEKALLERMRAIFGSRLVVWGSNLTPASKRKAVARVSGGEPYLLLGTRSALFLPHNNLKTIIIQDEHDSSYKQTSPAPRYNGRDAALLLASVFGAGCVLESATPSLETVFNCMSGKYVAVEETRTDAVEYMIVDTNAEQRKNGMTGLLSRKFLQIADDRTIAYKPRRAAFPKLEELEGQLSCPLTDDLVASPVPPGTRTLAIFGVDALLGKMDFRADERALQTIRHAVLHCPEGLEKVYIQTREAGHTIFHCLAWGKLDPILDERKSFHLPPFTRLLDVCFSDSSPERTAAAIEALAPSFARAGTVTRMGQSIRITLERDRSLSSKKAALRDAVGQYERDKKYAGHIYFDVDPI